MKRSFRLRLTVGALLACGASIGAVASFAQEEAVRAAVQAKAAQAEAAAKNAKEEAAKTADQAAAAAFDPNTIPTELPALLEYVKLGQNWQPKMNPALRRDPDAIQKIQAEIGAARGKLVEAVDKALALNPAATERVMLLKTKLNALQLMGMFGNKKADTDYETLVESLLKDSDAELARDAYRMSLMIRMGRFMEGKSGETPQQLTAELTKAMDDDATRQDAVMVALNATYIFEMKGQTELARTLYNDLIKAAPKLADTKMQKQVQMRAESGLSRLDLIGKPAILIGKTLDGTDFDIASLKGKVVLIDFWATWCQPCIMEMPNVVENYKKYHDKGFDVVGVSIDEDKERLEKFVAEKDVKWTTLFNTDDATRGFDDPSAKSYFVSGIPATYLVDKSGNIVAINVRGERLGELLEGLLGK